MTSNPTDPLHNSAITPGQAIPGSGAEEIGERGMPQKTFSLPDPAEASSKRFQAQSDHPSPMALAGQASEVNKLSPEEINQHLDQLRSTFSNIHDQLQNSDVTDKLTPDHWQAMKQVITKMNPDLRSIANETGVSFQPNAITGQKPGGLLSSIVNWINGSQQVMGGALNYLSSSDGKAASPEAYLKLQYSVQRASQRGELFASIISSSVSGIKTIMSTQLG